MKIEFIKVNNKNRHLAYKLSVFKEQKRNIETAYKSIREAREIKCWRPIIIALDNTFIGFAMYGLWLDEGKNGRVWLDRFFIDKNFQNKGYARLVLPILLEKIKNSYNYDKIYLSVYEDNKTAIKLYEEFGFKFNGEFDINKELVMVKNFKEEKMNIDFSKIQTPCYIVDEALLRKNLEILKSVQDRTGAKILLATKAFSMFSTFPIIAEYLHGVTSSSLFEARLGYEEMGKEVHIYAPAYMERDFDDIIKYSDHIVFNTFSQFNKYKDKIKNADKHIEVGIRINPEYSEIETDLYNPCFKNSRMGTTLEHFEDNSLEGIDGLHFHTMCEQNSDTLKRTLEVVDKKFGKYIKNMKWINFGGGHHITREDYDIETLVECINFIKEKYDGIEVYLEPGEAIALNTGFLVASVLDTMKNGMDIALLDTSATCHMPDVLEMPYRPHIIGADEKGVLPYTYRLGSPTCLSGDVIGDYSFEKPLKEGDKLVFCDMAIYSMVKNNTFNGINLPSIYLNTIDNGIKLIREFGYEDFKNRLS